MQSHLPAKETCTHDFIGQDNFYASSIVVRTLAKKSYIINCRGYISGLKWPKKASKKNLPEDLLKKQKKSPKDPLSKQLNVIEA